MMHPSTKRHLSHCYGYLDLSMVDDAHEEIEKIDDEDRLHKEVLTARIAIYTKAEMWDMVAAVSKHLANLHPEEPQWRINWAYGARRAESLDVAKSILLKALEHFPDNAQILYNLGCYACVEEIYGMASAFVKRAIELDKDLQKVAIEDEDLAKLWENVDFGKDKGSTKLLN